MGRPRIPPIPIACEGCGEVFYAPRYEHRRFCGKACSGRANGKGWERTGPRNHMFNGGLSEWDGRTIIVHRNGTWTFYYRALLEAHLGRELRSDEIVHHMNGDPSDDRLENLQIVTRAEHIQIHRHDLQQGWRAKKAAA